MWAPVQAWGRSSSMKIRGSGTMWPGSAASARLAWAASWGNYATSLGINLLLFCKRVSLHVLPAESDMTECTKHTKPQSVHVAHSGCTPAFGYHMRMVVYHESFLKTHQMTNASDHRPLATMALKKGYELILKMNSKFETEPS